MFEFLQPNFLYLIIPIIILVVFLYFKKSNTQVFWAFEDLKLIYKNNSVSYKLYYFVIGLIFIFSIIIFAQPVVKNSQEKIEKNGIDIMVALDVSLSMQAEDLRPNRIEAAKNIIVKFLDTLVSDRVWLVVFSWKPFTSIPLNFDYEVSKNMVDKITTKILDQSVQGLNGTAIWDAIIFAWDSFDNQNRQKVLILVTDWSANVWIDPIMAAKYLKDNSQKNPIKIYTIGIWWKENATIKYQHPLGFTQNLEVEWVDEQTLIQIAELSNAKYFRAENTQWLESIFQEISDIEKTPIETQNYESITSISKHFVYFLVILFGIFLVIRLRKKI